MSPSPSPPASVSSVPAFDPRQVPVVGVDMHLPPVPGVALTANALRQRWANPPIWQPELREEPRFSNRPRTQAAVLIGLVLGADAELHVVLTERTSHLPTHAGQVAFPGGKVDPEDASTSAAALREAWEEVGLAAEGIEVLGHLPEYTTGTAFVVTPVVALLPAQARFQANPHEVADIFQVPLPYLMNPANHRRHRVSWQGVEREWFSMPYLEPRANAPGEVTERFIWGATAGMLRNLYRFLVA